MKMQYQFTSSRVQRRLALASKWHTVVFTRCFFSQHPVQARVRTHFLGVVDSLDTTWFMCTWLGLGDS